MKQRAFLQATPETVEAALLQYQTERLAMANGVVLATRKGGDHMPFGLVSEKYGGARTHARTHDATLNSSSYSSMTAQILA